MSVDEKNLEKIALKHGVDFASFINRPTRNERLQMLNEVLYDQQVPNPIEPDQARRYMEMAESGKPFTIGCLGNGEQPDLGKYADEQLYDQYTDEEHLSWACLVADQQKSKHKYACREYLEGEQRFAISSSTIPVYYLLNARIYQQTKWQLATVTEIIPAEKFFTCHSLQYFPVTTFMRRLEEDYLEEPDIGHDIAGHVATFTIASVAQVMKNHGEARNIIFDESGELEKRAESDQDLEKIHRWRDELLTYAGRIYWFTVEFGLVMQNGKHLAFGAGILSSPGETEFSIDDPEPNRILIDPGDDRDLLRLAITNYQIREFQKTYFVMESFDRLQTVSPERIVKTAKIARGLPHYTWNEIAPGDHVIHTGAVIMHPNEKYQRLLENRPVLLRHSENCSDYCLPVTAVRNLRMMANGFDQSLLTHLRAQPPEVPDEIIEAFKKADEDSSFPSNLDDYEKVMGCTKTIIVNGKNARIGYGTELWPTPRPDEE